MRIDILTLFPDMFSALKESILGRAQREGFCARLIMMDYFFFSARDFLMIFT